MILHDQQAHQHPGHRVPLWCDLACCSLTVVVINAAVSSIPIECWNSCSSSAILGGTEPVRGLTHVLLYYCTSYGISSMAISCFDNLMSRLHKKNSPHKSHMQCSCPTLESTGPFFLLKRYTYIMVLQYCTSIASTHKEQLMQPTSLAGGEAMLRRWTSYSWSKKEESTN